MANPLKRSGEDEPPFGGHSAHRLLILCDEANRWSRRIGLRQWNYVEPEKDGVPAQAMRAEGATCDEVWAAWDGRTVQYHQWPEDKMDKINRRARWLLKQGLVA